MKIIYCDGAFKSIMDKVADNLYISMNYLNPDGHVPDIGRNNWVVQESFRIAYYRIHYKKITGLIIRHLAIISAT